MDDLSGLDWSSSNSSQNPPLRPTPSPSASGRSTPLNLQQSGSAGRVVKVGSKPSTPANDSFASLLGGGAGKNTTNVSLQERQRQLQDEKARQLAEQRKKFDAHFGGSNASFWDNQGQNGSRGSSATPSPAPGRGLTAVTAAKSSLQYNGKAQDGEDDILAAFNAAAPVDNSSHFPPPQHFDSGRSTPAQPTVTPNQADIASNNDAFQFNDDDDPFGLSEVKQKATSAPPPAATANDDDDILGMLGKPVSELPRPKPKEEPPLPPRRAQEEGEDEPADPKDKAVAELVDMGFPADKAAMALARTDNGMNVQAAVGILLNEAHEESRQKARGQTPGSERADSRDGERRRRPAEARSDDSIPAWARQERGGSRQRDNQSPAQEKDLAQTASEMGASFLKGANSLWKAGQKRVQKAVADFQQDGGDPSQPKWMRDTQLQQEVVKPGKKSQSDVTDEAAMLEGGGKPQKPARPQKSSQPAFVDELPRRPSPADRDAALPPRPSATRMTRQDLEDQTPELYVSPARRRGKATPQSSAPPSEPPSRPATRSPLASASSPLQSKNPFTQPQQPSSKPTPSPTSRPSPKPAPKPKPPPRQIPPVSPSALQQSHAHRLSGTESFKRGDYASAHTSYSAALAPLPPKHPLSVVLLCNRALTGLKTGDAKAAIQDAETALGVIGPGRGEGEKIELGDEGAKDMKEFWAKATTRKAEALEHLERYGDALGVWRIAVEAGVGGSAAIQARQRCEKAVAGASEARGKPATTRPQAARKPPLRPSAVSELAGRDSEAVKRMREANRAAEKADDEKFALTDEVDAKLLAWKGSKADNLRALLGSLDRVLWPEAGYVTFNSPKSGVFGGKEANLQQMDKSRHE